MANLSECYHVLAKLKGIAKQGHCRPTIAELFSPDVHYEYLWCSAEPIYDNLDELVLANDESTVLI